MNTKDIILELRNKAGLSQDELAEKIYVTRQAVSRWENGETIPSVDALKLLSEVFDVSIDTLLGTNRKHICQCCGMPINESIISKDKDGKYNEDYCQYCFVDGEYTYENMDDLIEYCIENRKTDDLSTEEFRMYLKQMLPKLNYWKDYATIDGENQFNEFKKALINEINDLHIEGMTKLESLNALAGEYVNLEYRLPNGQLVKFLDDYTTYLGNQLECEFDCGFCFGIVANMDFILVCTYEENGENPELIVYKKR